MLSVLKYGAFARIWNSRKKALQRSANDADGMSAAISLPELSYKRGLFLTSKSKSSLIA